MANLGWVVLVAWVVAGVEGGRGLRGGESGYLGCIDWLGARESGRGLKVNLGLDEDVYVVWWVPVRAKVIRNRSCQGTDWREWGGVRVPEKGILRGEA